MHMSDFYTGKEPGQNNQQANPQQHPDGKNQASGPSNEYYYHKSEIDGTTNATTHTDQYQAYQPGSAGAQNNASYGGNDRYRWHYETYEKAAKKNGRKNGGLENPIKG